MNIKRKILGVPLWVFIITIVACATSIGALVTYNLYYPQKAEITVVGQIKVYLDADLTQELGNGTTIDWGTLDISLVNVFTKNLWIKNTGEVTVVITFETADLPLLWGEILTPVGLTIAPGEVKTVTLTLTVPFTATAGTYVWDSWITATEV